MPSKKKRLQHASLYLILDTQVLSCQQLLSVLKDAVRFGIDIVQLRNKFGHAKEILAFCRKAQAICGKKTLFIVNDRVDVAMLADADGVHLGQDDISYAQARRLMGKDAIIGVSCQNLTHARRAQAEGADYIGFGSIFKTKTKPERKPMQLVVLKKVWGEIKIPVFPIGGISRKNIGQLRKLGITRAAICRDILLSAKPGQVIKELKCVL